MIVSQRRRNKYSFITHKIYSIDTTEGEDSIIMDNLFANLLMTKKDYKAKVKRQQQKQLSSAIPIELNAMEMLESIYE